MRCLTCWQEINSTNRQTYKHGLRLPYCRNCIDGYLAKDRLSKMTTGARMAFILESSRRLHGKVYNKEEMQDAKNKLLNMGITEEEITIIFKKAKTK